MTLVLPHPRDPRFDITIPQGERGEVQIRELLHWLGSGDLHIEVKTKSYIDLELYIEMECDKGARGRYVPSGLQITEALAWCFVIGTTGIHVAIPTAYLRAAVTWPSSRPKAYPFGDYPTRGMLVNFGMLLRYLRQQEGVPIDAGASVPAPTPPAGADITHLDISWGISR